MRIIRFDTEGLTKDCPISDIGVVTIMECQDCDWFAKFIFMDKAECSWDSPEQMPE